jgi:ADP-heptose:LPS heptosyltransferase
MANSTVLVGPSSGPVHLASLCGLPHVTWSPKNATGIMSNKDRYERIWNPLKTPVTFIEGSWNPEVKEIVGAVRKYYDN